MRTTRPPLLPLLAVVVLASVLAVFAYGIGWSPYHTLTVTAMGCLLIWKGLRDIGPPPGVL